RGELIKRLDMVGVLWKHQRKPCRCRSRGILEQARVVPLHLAQMIKQRVGELIASEKPEEAREPLELLGGCRQGVRLLVGDHLQTMLDAGQEQIGGVEVVRRLGGDPAALCQGLKSRQRSPPTQVRMAAARNELLCLHEELDLADAATPELDIVAFDG